MEAYYFTKAIFHHLITLIERDDGKTYKTLAKEARLQSL